MKTILTLCFAPQPKKRKKNTTQSQDTLHPHTFIGLRLCIPMQGRGEVNLPPGRQTERKKERRKEGKKERREEVKTVRKRNALNA